MGDGRVRLSDADLHRAACKAIYEGNHIVFDSLPTLVRQIIANKSWKAFGKSNFAEYALDQSSNGLGVNSNQRLWILRCSMDVHGEHIKEWADVLAKVEEMVKAIPVAERGSARALSGNSLETLAKECAIQHTQKITFLPSRSTNLDGHLVRLRKNKPDVFKQVVRGEISMIEARKAAGVGTTPEMVARLLAGTAVEGKWREAVTGHVGRPSSSEKNDNVIKLRAQQGNSRAFTLARLEREAPNLAAAVHAGEY